MKNAVSVKLDKAKCSKGQYFITRARSWTWPHPVRTAALAVSTRGLFLDRKLVLWGLPTKALESPDLGLNPDGATDNLCGPGEATQSLLRTTDPLSLASWGLRMPSGKKNAQCFAWSLAHGEHSVNSSRI